MNGYNFTNRVRNVLEMARNDAILRRHPYVGTEHLLLGLMREEDGVAAAVFQNLGPNLPDIQATIERIITSGKADTVSSSPIPYTSRGKKVLELAMDSARELNCEYVGSEHLLLGLLREETGIAAQVLKKAGLTQHSARAEVLRLWGRSSELGPLASQGTVTSVRIEVGFANGRANTEVFATLAEAIAYLQK